MFAVCDGHHYCLVGKMLRTAVSQTLNKARLVSPTVKVNNRKCIFTIRARRSALEELQLEKETDTVPGDWACTGISVRYGKFGSEGLHFVLKILIGLLA